MLSTLQILIFALSIFSVAFGTFEFTRLSQKHQEKNKITQLSELVREGLQSFSHRIVSNVLQLVIYLTLVLLLFSYFFDKPFYWTQIIAFLMSSLIMCGLTYLTLYLAPKLIPLTLQESHGYIETPLKLLFTSSSSIAFMVLGETLFGLVLCEVLLGPDALIGYSAGLIFASFFLRVGGSMFKTASDIGSEVVKDLDDTVPQFDHRSPGTLMDICGDYIGHLTGFGSDILGSYVFAIVAMILFPLGLIKIGMVSPHNADLLMMLPHFVLALGLISAFVGYFISHLRVSYGKFSNFLLEGIYVSILISGVFTYQFISRMQLSINGYSELDIFLPYVFGLIGAVLIGFSSEVLTSNRFPFAKKLAAYAEFGTVIVLIRALSMGFRSVGVFLIYTLSVVLLSFYFSGFYGIVMAALGMQAVMPSILLAKFYSPFASHAKKIALLVSDNEQRAKNMQRLDQIGSTTLALGNGFATGAGAMATLALVFSLGLYSEIDITQISLVDLKLLAGLFIGVTFPYLFLGFLLPGLQKTILGFCKEVSRQFKEIPFLYEDKAKPDLVKAVDNVSRYSLDALIIPGAILALVPIFIGYVLGVNMLLGFLFGIFLMGFNQGFVWGSFGEILHDAKRYIATGNFGGKGTKTFTNITVADNFGDSFKDLISPSLNIMMKSITIISALIVVFLLRT